MRCWQVAKPVCERETQNLCASAKHTLETKEISEQAGGLVQARRGGKVLHQRNVRTARGGTNAEKLFASGSSCRAAIIILTVLIFGQ